MGAKQNVRVLKKIITDADFKIKLKGKGPYDLKAECRVKIREPKDTCDNTVLIDVLNKLSMPDNTDFSISIEARFYFELNPIPSDYNDVVEKHCLPIAQNELYNDIDNMLKCMGYPAINLADQKEK